MKYPKLPTVGVRLVIGLLVGALFLRSADRLSHRCHLGYKWFESHGPLLFAGGLVMLVLLIPRYRLILPLVIAYAAAFHFLVVPRYLNWVHAPSDRGSDTQRSSITEQLCEFQTTVGASGEPIHFQ